MVEENRGFKYEQTKHKPKELNRSNQTYKKTKQTKTTEKENYITQTTESWTN